MIVSPRKIPDQPAALGQPKNLRQRPVGNKAFKTRDGAGRQDQHAMRGLSAQHLLPAEGHDIQLVPGQFHRKGGAGRVADRQPVAVGGNRIAIRHPHARGGAVPGEDHVLVEIHFGEIDDLAVIGLADRGVQFQLLDRVGDPAFAKAFPGQHLDRAFAQHRPHRHLDGAGVRGRHDADAVIVRHAQNLARQIDRLGQLRLADSGAMRAAQRRIGQQVQIIFGKLGTGARGKTRIGRPRGRDRRIAHVTQPSS